MLSWWLNRPGEGERVEGDELEQETPGTPAPVFAARALKSALFGTPAPPTEDTALELKVEPAATTGREAKVSYSYDISPTKPQGILLTPGTATARRKTVSFGAEVSEENEKSKDEKGAIKCGQYQTAHKERSSNTTSRKTSLTKSLESVRDTKRRKRTLERSRATPQSNPLIGLDHDTTGIGEIAESRPSTTDSATSQTSNQDLLLELITNADLDGDVTIDLNEPHSQSGKYWKSEYDRYKGEAKTEMEKLLKHKQLVKSYAKKKDAETVVLNEKLKEKKRQVICLEDRILNLSKQLAANGFEESNDASGDLVKELAKQTSLARKYQAEAAELRSTREQGGTPRPMHGELGDHISLNEETQSLQKALSAEQEICYSLRKENERISQELMDEKLRYEEHDKKSDRLRKVAEEKLRNKTESYKILQQDFDSLKEKAKAQRGNAEYLLKQKHDQIAALRKELSAMKKADLLARDRQHQQEKEPLHEGSGTLSQVQTAHLAQEVGGAMQVAASEDKRKPANSGMKIDANLVQLEHTYNLATRKSQSHTPSQLGLEATKSSLAPHQSHSLRTPPAALSEVTNSASAARCSPRDGAVVGHTPSSQISNIPRGTPSLDLPSPEPPVSHRLEQRIAHNKSFKPSPRPSMFTFSPNPASRQPRPLDKVHGQVLDEHPRAELETNMVSTRLPSLGAARARTTLPPERIAAARARLEKKNAEKRRAQALGLDKENAGI